MTKREWRRACHMEALASWDNLLEASIRARRGKSRRPDVDAWWLHRETHLARIRSELLEGAWAPSPYRHFVVHHPKRREIAAAPFGDRVVHHALFRLMAPVLERRFIARSFSCQVGKGTTAAREACRRLTNQHSHVLKCDVRKFFPNMDHAVLTGLLEPWVECARVRELVRRIIASHRTGPDVPPPWFPGEDWTEAVARPRGLPIGNLTSQLWANFYMDPLDHWVTETQAHGEYIRYTDDFLLFGNSKERLWELHSGIVEFLARLRLQLARPKSRLMATAEGVPFCGFRFLPSVQPRVLGATKRRFEARRLHAFRTRDFRSFGRTVAAWYAFSREGNSLGLRRAYAMRRRS
ncbi:MAG: RNA-directed DNA polymerase [Verrucomicrobiota bacterium]